jgi:hypothetical protein
VIDTIQSRWDRIFPSNIHIMNIIITYDPFRVVVSRVFKFL